jgi:hypothetical protein
VSFVLLRGAAERHWVVLTSLRQVPSKNSMNGRV